jgi:hypothetical protein
VDRLAVSSKRALAVVGLALLFGGAAVAVLAGRGDGGETAAAPARTTPPPTSAAPAPAAPPAPPRLVAVPLRGLRGFDPEGDGRERDETAPLATDGDPATYWQSERYTSFFKDGVGLLLDAGRSVRVTRVVVVSGTPGVAASIRVGASADGPFTPVSPTKRLGASTAFQLRPRPARYVVVWVEDIPDGGAAHVNEVRAQRAG